jgi:hypothetical protein
MLCAVALLRAFQQHVHLYTGCLYSSPGSWHTWCYACMRASHLVPSRCRLVSWTGEKLSTILFLHSVRNVLEYRSCDATTAKQLGEQTMNKTEMNRRLRDVPASALREAHRMILEGNGGSTLRHETYLTVKQINALFAWVERYGRVSPVAGITA